VNEVSSLLQTAGGLLTDCATECLDISGYFNPFNRFKKIKKIHDGNAPKNETLVKEGTATPWKDGATPNSIYTQKSADGKLQSINYYDENGKRFSMEHYNQKAPHKVTLDGEEYNLKNNPHEHQTRTIEGPNSSYQKKQVRILDENGKPVTGWGNER